MQRFSSGITKFPHRVDTERLGAFAFLFASIVCLFLGFYLNFWGVVESGFFEDHQIVMESFIVGRILKTERDGLFSAGGLPGLSGPDETPPDIENANYQFQYQAYRDSLPIRSFTPYLSQNGMQGILFGILDGILPFSNSDKLSIFYGLTSLLLATVLAVILEWFRREFGWTAAIFSLISVIVSQWMTVFGRNLWWSTWAFYLPMVILLLYLNKVRGASRLNLIRFGAIVFFAVFLKCCFNGFEYITTTLTMMTAPFVYFAVLEQLGWKEITAGMLTAAVSSILAILSSMTALCIQIGNVTGNFSDGVNHIFFSLLRRSYADPSLFPADYQASLTANPAEVVWIYLSGVYLDLKQWIPSTDPFIANYIFKIRYLYLIFLFCAASIILHFLLREKSNSFLRLRGQALIATLYLSFLAPLSWLVIFKAHSYVHTFMNNIIWQMPYTLFGFAVCGLAVRTALREIRKQHLEISSGGRSEPQIAP
ncbi:MAG: hypothetical protein JW929_07010 [Anaerolineales bacterium]|nr:hypothetical protein [Anaerolineales bacterium]